jgi:hypothetical protein
MGLKTAFIIILGGGVPWRQCCTLGMCTNSTSVIAISGHIIHWA